MQFLVSFFVLQILVPVSGKTSFSKKEEEKDNLDPQPADKLNVESNELPDVSLSARPLSPVTPTIQDMIQTTVAPAVDNVEFRSEKEESPSPPRASTPDSPSARSSPIKTPSPVKKKTSSPPRCYFKKFDYF